MKIRQKDSFTLSKVDGRFWFKESLTDSTHSISADPAITSSERLEAHWKGFREGIKMNNLSSDSAISDVKDALKKCRAKLRAMSDVDFVSRELEIMPVDADGERIEDLLDYEDNVTLKLIREVFSDERVAGLVIVSTGRGFEDPSLPMREKYDFTFAVDHACLDILR